MNKNVDVIEIDDMESMITPLENMPVNNIDIYNPFIEEGIINFRYKNFPEEMGVVYFKLYKEKVYLERKIEFKDRTQTTLKGELFRLSGEVKEKYFNKFYSKDDCIEALKVTYKLVAATLNRINYLERNKKYDVVTVEREYTNKNKRNKQIKKVRKQKTVITLGETKKIYIKPRKETIENFKKRTYKREKEAWLVRGFYRTYKSGKVVFVKPHTRGKNKNSEIEGKLYKI